MPGGKKPRRTKISMQKIQHTCHRHHRRAIHQRGRRHPTGWRIGSEWPGERGPFPTVQRWAWVHWGHTVSRWRHRGDCKKKGPAFRFRKAAQHASGVLPFSSGMQIRHSIKKLQNCLLPPPPRDRQPPFQAVQHVGVGGGVDDVFAGCGGRGGGEGFCCAKTSGGGRRSIGTTHSLSPHGPQLLGGWMGC